MLRPYQQNAVDAALNHYRYRPGIHGYVTAPGGSGKSHMIAGVAERVHDLSVGRVVVLARSEKLLSQNKSKFQEEYQQHIGVYCAGLGRKELDKPITIASAQSIAGCVMENVAAILVDECDEISSDEESQYQQFFTSCGNPPIIGFTATPFRTGPGKITWGEEIINIPLKAIMDAGFLTPPTNKVGTTLDLSHVQVRIGEYVQGQLEAIYDDPELLALSVKKIKQYSAERSGVLIFCQSLRHADILANAMEFNGMPVTTVDGNTDKEELGFILDDFEEGRIKYLLNCQLLTRGYDMPCVDMIVILRATKSKRLFEQMLYRGTRLKEGKRDFLVLDMGNNLSTHGPLGSPHTDGSGKEQGKYSGKICPACEDFVIPATAKECSGCSYQFPEAERPKIDHARHEDSSSETVYAGEGDICTYDVTEVIYKKHKSRAGNETLMVQYFCGYGKYGNISEWLSPFHATSDWARDNAQQFFKERGNALGSPINTYNWDDLLWHATQLKKPLRITVNHKGEFPRITKYHWEEKKQEQQLSIESYLGEAPL